MTDWASELAKQIELEEAFETGHDLLQHTDHKHGFAESGEASNSSSSSEPAPRRKRGKASKAIRYKPRKRATPSRPSAAAVPREERAKKSYKR